jgi:regulator of sigma E protease
MENIGATLAHAWSGWIWPLLQFLIGLGVVIVVHEFGHFIVAKWVKIRVERFALGFGPRLLGIKIGETDYCINAFPLGGYIKMSGQEDFRPLEEVSPDDHDEHSWRFASVGARMGVVSAGVIMNAILAVVLFVVIAMIGRDFPAPVLGSVRAGFPAAETKITWLSGPSASASQPATQPVVTTGLLPGDRITRIEGKGLTLAIVGNDVDRFDRLALMSIMASPDERFKITVERQVDGKTWVGTADMGVKVGPSETGGTRLSFGIAPSAALTVDHGLDYTSTPAVDPFQDGDRVQAVAGKPVAGVWQVEPMLAGLPGLTVPVTVLRAGKEVDLQAPRGARFAASTVYLKDGTKLDIDKYTVTVVKDDKDKGDKDKEVVVLESLADHSQAKHKRSDLIFAQAEEIFDLLGMVPRLRITGIIRGSPAEKADLKAGDVVLHYGDDQTPTVGQLTRISKKVGEAGTDIVVERDGKQVGPFHITPLVEKDKATLGVCRHVDLDNTVVAAVRPGSPAAKAGVQPGSVVEKVNDRAVKNWMEVFDALKALRGQEVALTCRPSSGPGAAPSEVKLGKLDAAAFDPDDYEFTIFPGPQEGFLSPLLVNLRKDSFGPALVWSLREAGGFMVSTYASITAFFRGTVSKKDFMGPVGIGAIAIHAAQYGFMHLVYVMAFLSAILAVMNFLPLPVVDGGAAVVLIIEKIRGKPVPVGILNVVQFVGLAALVLLFLALTWQDIARLVGG